MASTPPSAKAGRGRRLALGLASLAVFVLFWNALALKVGAPIVLPPPELVLQEILGLYPTQAFLEALGGTLLRGGAAFALSAGAGILAGTLAGLSPSFEAALSPCLTIIRATPVLALILVAALWFPYGVLPVFAAFLTCFPVMVTSSAAGARAADPGLLEMLHLFKVHRVQTFLKLRLPAAAPHLLAGAKNALGLSWKVVVSVEVIAQPFRSIGAGMQGAQRNLETPLVFAWAVAAIILCGLTEWLFGLAVKAVLRHGA